MATVADELLNDFEDSGSENEEERTGDDAPADSTGSEAQNGSNEAPVIQRREEGIEYDGDEDNPADAVPDDDAPSHLNMEDAEDEEETKARVEKMELKAVNDVRSVAVLMRQLNPVVEVSLPSIPPLSSTVVVYIFA